MPVRESRLYERGSAEEGAHLLLIRSDVDVERVFRVDDLEDGIDAITFTAAGSALTAFADEETVLHVAEGWDLPAPGGAWRDRL